MRLLNFIVHGQTLSQDPECSFDDIIAGSKKYIKINFKFDKEVDKYRKIASFSDGTIKEYMPIIDGECSFPESLASKKYVRIGVLLIFKKQYIPTNTITIRQEVTS